MRNTAIVTKNISGYKPGEPSAHSISNLYDYTPYISCFSRQKDDIKLWNDCKNLL